MREECEIFTLVKSEKQRRLNQSQPCSRISCSEDYVRHGLTALEQRSKPGSNPPSYDKQFVRDWLEASGWNKQSPAPELPVEVAAKTGEKYREAVARLTT